MFWGFQGFDKGHEKEHSIKLFEDNYEEQEQESEEEIQKEEEENYENQYQECDNYGDVKQEIATIWNTINKVINNTQDCFHELKSEIMNTSMNREGLSHYGLERSSLDPKGNETKPEQQQKSSIQEKSLQDIIIEVKDEVHNQIVQVMQRLY